MPILILLLFIGVPVAEIALFIEIGGEIGLGWTLAAIVATALIGTFLVRQQGLATLARARAEMDRQKLPVAEMITGVCILLAGALLLTPGFLTDAVGFVLLIPPLRSAVAGAAIKRMRASGRFTVHAAGGPARGASRPPPGRGPVIDGDFEEVSPDTTPDGPPDPNSPWNKSDDGPDGRIEDKTPPRHR